MLSKIQHFTEIIILVLIFVLTNLRSFIFWGLFPSTYQISGPAWREILIWLLLLILIIYIMSKQGLWESFLSSWGKRLALIAFISYAIISVFWSVTWTGTLYRSLTLLFTTFVAIYLSRRYSMEEMIQILFWVGIIVISASLYLAIANPELGRDFNPPYNGAWRGIFWHKNHLGNIIPLFSLIFLLRIFRQPFQFFRFEKIAAIIFYLLSLILVYEARSASGYILLLIVHFVFIVLAIWVYVYRQLKPAHYWIALVFFLIGALLVAFNLNFIFGLFNRETSLTGRVPLWQYLIKEVFLVRPVVGYGFGSLWTLASFRTSTQRFVGWGYQVMIGDNGFLDILLNGGIVGLALFLVVYMQTWVASVRYTMIYRTIISLFPLIFVLYSFFVNISFSLFLETESFIWMLLVYLLFLGLQQPPNPEFNYQMGSLPND